MEAREALSEYLRILSFVSSGAFLSAGFAFSGGGGIAWWAYLLLCLAILAASAFFLFRLIRAAFNQRRKTLVNALANAPDTGLDKEQAARILEIAGLDPKVRGEKLGLAEFAALADAIMQKEDL